ncbi:DUF1279 super [Malassezia obtusa]|uniref:DUF1279 super n=1 Tax=Malassezia obtusa TaxID=76774 RepID=A0AAF0E1L6_9BASI|nr:DUF1279 super [Malassezia obtusa]
MSSLFPYVRVPMAMSRLGMRISTTTSPACLPRVALGAARHPFPAPARTATLQTPRSFATGPAAQQTPNPSPPNASEGAKPNPENEEPPKGGLRQRLRFIMRRYGWWALGIYLAIGTVDLSIAFAVVHIYGGDRVREIERVVRGWIGLAQKETEEMVQQSPDTEKSRPLVAPQSELSDTQKLLAQLSTEFVLAYGIHKTLFLPPRAAVTAAITPAVVRWMVRP